MANRVHDEFDGVSSGARWNHWTTGTGAIVHDAHSVRFELPSATAQQYSDAQITDYAPRTRDLRWRPPLRMTVRAWASHAARDLRGTAGFGFWNEPFVPGCSRLPRLPRAVWFFFGSPPNNMALAYGVPGYGGKAATLDATRLPFLLLAPLAPLGFAVMRIPAVYRALWPVGQWAIGASEALLPVDLDSPHTYRLDWLADAVVFAVDGEVVHRASSAPRGPLGFIAWMDNQYAVVTPQGRFAFGLVSAHEGQWLLLDRVTIESL